MYFFFSSLCCVIFVSFDLFNQYIFEDDSIKKIKEKICVSIKLNDIFITSGTKKHECYLKPNSIYLWSKYNYISLFKNYGTKWQ